MTFAAFAGVTESSRNLKEKVMVKIVVQWVSGILLTGLVALSSWAGPVDLNSADAETIARELNGIGASRAKAIVEYREQYGAFSSAEDLLNVTGIGPHILQANKANIMLSQTD
jgi:competence protein ComEA